MADLDGGLSGNDMVWRLTNGLTNAAKNDAINPIRYGARTVWDYYTYRYSVFSKDQSMAIVSYLKYKLDEGELMDSERTDIIEALENYWLAR